MEKETVLSASQLSYLLTILQLDKNGDGVRSVALSKELCRSKPSVHNMLLSLYEMELVEKENRGLVFLTEKGKKAAYFWQEKYDFLLKKIAFSEDLPPPRNALCAFLSQLSREEMDLIF